MATKLPKIGKIPEGEVLLLIPTKLDSMITGVFKAGFKNDGSVTLVYVDDEREAAQFSLDAAQALYDQAFTDNGSFFAVVSAVQAQRKISAALKLAGEEI